MGAKVGSAPGMRKPGSMRSAPSGCAPGSSTPVTCGSQLPCLLRSALLCLLRSARGPGTGRGGADGRVCRGGPGSRCRPGGRRPGGQSQQWLQQQLLQQQQRRRLTRDW